jgi:hypothetical protein
MFSRNRLIQLAVTFIGLSIILGFLTADTARSATDNLCGTGDRDSSPCNIVHGFQGNQVTAGMVGATISGGGERFLPNQITGDYGTIGGGQDNQAGDRATVSGGSDNAAIGFRSAIGGGSNNIAQSAYATIAGGINNSATYIDTTIGGGTNNSSSGRDSTIAGGSGNIASFTEATVAGGAYNTSSGLAATIGGGSRNLGSGTYATIAGGTGNRADSLDTTVGGGSGNAATADDATVSGGLSNRATEKYSTVSGGYENLAGNANDDPRDAEYATVAGGANNNASGSYAMVLGGSSNVAAGSYSLAAGRRAKISAAQRGAFVFADSTNADFSSAAANEFAVRATGGARIVTGVDASGNPISGVRLAPGGGAWQVLSDRAAKANITPVDGQEILRELASIPIDTFNYKSQDAAIHHIGPMAQDFARLGVGENDKYINEMDANGVALAAIQGLDQIVSQQAAKIKELQAANAAQQAQIAALSARLDRLESSSGGAPSSYDWLPLSLFGLVIGLLVLRR